jgi:hypothetical protein
LTLQYAHGRAFYKNNFFYTRREMFINIRLLLSHLLLLAVVYNVAIADLINYTEIHCAITPMMQRDTNCSHPHIPGPQSLRVPANIATSTNWCGYIAEKNFSTPTKNSVSAVSGSWIVPKLVSTPRNSYCAIWVGIDGYSSPTVEQIGTSHNWINGMQQNYTWFEMYPNGAFVIGGFPLSPGDVISASVVYSGNSIFTLTIVNDTKRIYFTVPTSYTHSSTALRESAEWIIEAPYLNGILPLSDFVTAYLWGCIATISGVTAPIKNNSWQNLAIEMVTNNNAPKAIPSSLLSDNGSFFGTWAHV